MTKYLLTCECGRSLPVEPGQAGGRVACECGAQLEVPTLRKLRHLPVAAPESEWPASRWSARKGVITVFGLLALVGAVSGLWLRLIEPTVPPFDPVSRTEAVDEFLQEMTPQQAWHLWIEYYRPLAEQGFSPFQHRDAAAIEKQIAQKRFLQKTLWWAAGICAAIALAAALWPRSAPRRG